jgi:allantoin racemase
MSHDIRIITPVTTHGIRSLEDVRPYERGGVRFSHALLDSGPVSIESEFDEAYAVPDMLKRVAEAEEAGCNAVIIDCLGDPGLRPAREIASIPVLGPGEISFHTAAMLGQRFSIVTVLDSVKPIFRNNATLYGVANQLASIRVVNVPVLEIEKDLPRIHRLLAEQALCAVREDDAEVVILGCTGFCGCGSVIEAKLRQETGMYIPVIDPIPLTAVTAIAWVEAGLAQSKRTYAQPVKKPMTGYALARSA